MFSKTWKQYSNKKKLMKKESVSFFLYESVLGKRVCVFQDINTMFKQKTTDEKRIGQSFACKCIWINIYICGFQSLKTIFEQKVTHEKRIGQSFCIKVYLVKCVFVCVCISKHKYHVWIKNNLWKKNWSFFCMKMYLGKHDNITIQMHWFQAYPFREVTMSPIMSLSLSLIFPNIQGTFTCTPVSIN